MPQKRIPTPTQDAGNWGNILNDHLAQTQNPINGAFNSFDQFSSRPANLTADDVGRTYLYTQTSNWHEWSGSEWKVQNKSEINVKDYGAIGDGVVDDTVAIQKAVDDSPEHTIITGIGGNYLVGAVNLKSNIIFENFNFTTKATSTTENYYSPVTIGRHEEKLKKYNITVRNVKVYGNRVLQTNLPSTASENGGRHGFRLIGYCDRITIENCSATYCASDGIELFSGYNTRYPNDFQGPTFTNILIKNCNFNYNRRHGGSCDSVDGLTFENCNFNFNGIDLNNGDTEGNKGDRINTTVLYGNGFDVELYGADTINKNLIFESCNFTNNAATGLYFTTPTDPRETQFRPSSQIRITNCNIEKGGNGYNLNHAFIMESPYSNWSLGIAYKNICISNCFVNGEVRLTQIKNLTIDGSFISNNSRSDLGQILYSNNVKIGCINTEVANLNFETLGLSDVKYTSFS